MYFPQKHAGFFDGTAPHTVEPALFGASGEYLDLGAFCRTEALDPARIRALNADCAMFRLRAQQYLDGGRRARSARDAGAGLPRGSRGRAPARQKRLHARIRHAAKDAKPGRCDRLFLSAVTSEGKIFFPDTVAAHCARVYLLDDGCGLAEEFLHTVRAHAVRCGLDVISCPDALIPSRTQAVLVPSRGVGFLAGTAEDVLDGLSQRHIRLDVLPDPERQRTLRRAMRSDARQQQLALERAVEQLRMAALLHNELEAVYRPCMDFDALSAFTERYLKTFPGV